MHNTKRRNKLKKPTRANRPSISQVKFGTANQPAVNTGTVQIPRTITVRSQHVRRVFKQDYTVSTGTATPAYFGASLYAPFYATNTSSTSFALSQPAGLVDMLGAFGFYKVKRIQLVVSPLITVMSVPSPYTAAMTFDVTAANALSLSVQQLTGYQNSVKVDPTFPTEIGYIVPPPSAPAGDMNNTVLKGGWIDSTSGTAPGLKGLVVMLQTVGYTVSTPYSIVTLCYEIWFKNPN